MDEKELILKIMKEALEINSEQRNTIFINYFGHVNGLEVQIHTNGWQEEQKPDYYRTVYMRIQNKKQNQKELLEILEKLKKIKELSKTDQSHDSSNR